MFDWLIALVAPPADDKRVVVTPQTPTPQRPGEGLKPHLWPVGPVWKCRSNSHSAFGRTPKEAYTYWAVALYNSNANPYQPTAYPDGKSFVQWH